MLSSRFVEDSDFLLLRFYLLIKRKTNLILAKRLNNLKLLFLAKTRYANTSRLTTLLRKQQRISRH